MIGGSAGCFHGLRTIVCGLPADLPAAVFVVIHLRGRSESHLDEVLARLTPLRVVKASEAMPIQSGNIYVAVPDRHLTVGLDHIHVTRSPKEGLHRPSINVSFRSAAAMHRDEVIGVLLSGMLDDGASGLWDVARHGGVTIVQDIEEAPFPSMPMSALEAAPVNYRLKADQIAAVITELVAGVKVNAMQPKNVPIVEAPPQPNIFTCPECRGPLHKHRDAPIEFKCRVGHVFPLMTLIDEATSTQERKLYEAIVALEEGADLAEYAAKERLGNGNLVREAEQLRQHAASIRKLIEERTTPFVD